MKPFFIVGLVLAGIAVIAGGSRKRASPRDVTSKKGLKTADEKVSGLPLVNGLSVRQAKNHNEFTSSAHIGSSADNGLILTIDGRPVSFTSAKTDDDKKAWKILNLAWAERRKSLPFGASSSNWDQYSKEAYNLPSWLLRSLDGPAAAVTQFPVDEFGRIKQGHYGNGGGLWESTFGGLMKNPLFRAVVISAIAASGPGGIAALGAYTMWQNRGRDLSLQNAALATARAYAVSQCGEACGVAFDFGVGVASGKSVNTAAEDALVSHMTPTEKAYYNQGKKLVNEIR